MKLADLPAETLAVIGHMLRSETNTQGIDPQADLPEPTGWHVLCLQYVRGDTIRTAGGVSLILAETTRKEDQYQGRIGVVLALGPTAYQGERFGNAPWVKPGDLVAWPALENASGRYAFGTGVLAVVPDDRLTLSGCNVQQMVGR